MIVKCYCGSEVDLPRNRHNQLLMDMQIYCSPDCFAAYLYNLPPAAQIKQALHQVLSTGDLYDPITQCWYRSWFEVYVGRFFRAKGIKADYEGQTLFISMGSRYTPDFWLPKYDLYVEVKGLWQGSGKKKFKAAVRTGYNMALLPGYLEPQFSKEYRQPKETVVIK